MSGPRPCETICPPPPVAGVLTGITSTSGAVIGATSAGAAIGTVTGVGIGGAAGAVVGLVIGSMAKCFYTKCSDGP